MSIASEITRLQNAKADIKTAIEAKGVTIPSNATLDEYSDYVEEISTGITPTGTINITENGTHDVTNYASANVNVSGGETLKISAGTSIRSGYYDTFGTILKLEIVGTSGSRMFNNYGGVIIPRLENTQNLTSGLYMFANTQYVTNYNLQDFNSSNMTDMSFMFNQSNSPQSSTQLDLSNFNTSKVKDMRYMFGGFRSLAILDISNFTFDSVTSFSGMFSKCGASSKQTDGAYADGIPYVYVKDATAQNWVLTANNGHPNTWTTDNVIIKNS